MKKYYTINNVTYELILVDEVKPKFRKPLTACYKSCSQAKYSVYKHWEKVAHEMKYLCDYGIDSYNTNFIIIGYDFNHPQFGFVSAHITPAHNYLYVAKDSYTV